MTSFLDLPPEIRNRIYCYTWSIVPSLIAKPERYVYEEGAFTLNGRLLFTYAGTIRSSKEEAPFVPPQQPSISRTCRQIRSETLPIFYGANSFNLCDIGIEFANGIEGSLKDVFKWLDVVKHHVPLMKNVIVTSYPISTQGESDEILRLLKENYAFKDGVLTIKAEDTEWVRA